MSDVFYHGELKPGVGTALSDKTRAMSRVWKTKISSLYPILREETEGLIYPVFFDLRSECQDELGGGSSKVNLYNVAATMDHIRWVIKSGIAEPHESGIAIPYGGQVDAYYLAMDKVVKEMPGVRAIRVGRSGW